MRNVTCNKEAIVNVIIEEKLFYFMFINYNFAPYDIESPINSFLDD